MISNDEYTIATAQGVKARFEGKNTTDNPYTEDLDLAEYWLNGFAGDACNLAQAVMDYNAGDNWVLDDDLPDATRDFVELSLTDDLTAWIRRIM